MCEDSRILPWHEEQLRDVIICLSCWNPVPGWDHEHCAFCWEKFAEQKGCLRAGYATEDGRHWICPECFQDLRGRFGWQVQEVASACMEVEGK